MEKEVLITVEEKVNVTSKINNQTSAVLLLQNANPQNSIVIQK